LKDCAFFFCAKPHASEKAILRLPNVASLINPNFAVEFKESDKIIL
jgi:hypothetical protein